MSVKQILLLPLREARTPSWGLLQQGEKKGEYNSKKKIFVYGNPGHNARHPHRGSKGVQAASITEELLDLGERKRQRLLYRWHLKKSPMIVLSQGMHDNRGLYTLGSHSTRPQMR